MYYIKTNGTYQQVQTSYVKQNGVWVETTETPTYNYLQTKPSFYLGEAPTTKYVTNLLPQYTQDYWVFDRFNGGNYAYSPTNYSSESVKPSGNVVVLFTNPGGNVSEAYIYPKPEYYPPLIKGHRYYLRWLSRKEQITNSSGQGGISNNEGVSEDVYWPEMENAWIRGLNNSSYNLFRFNSMIITPQSSQWPNNTVADGNYKIRFDCNNNKKYVKYWCTADFMLIDLTADYTNQGYSIPSKSELDAKSYFYGQTDIESW